MNSTPTFRKSLQGHIINTTTSFGNSAYEDEPGYLTPSTIALLVGLLIETALLIALATYTIMKPTCG